MGEWVMICIHLFTHIGEWASANFEHWINMEAFHNQPIETSS